jgi:hypothetical protein
MWVAMQLKLKLLYTSLVFIILLNFSVIGQFRGIRLSFPPCVFTHWLLFVLWSALFLYAGSSKFLSTYGIQIALFCLFLVGLKY